MKNVSFIEMNRHKHKQRACSPHGQHRLEKSLVANTLAQQRRKAPKLAFRLHRSRARETPWRSFMPKAEARVTVVGRRELQSPVNGDRTAQTLSLILHGITLIAFGVIASFGLDFFLMSGLRWGFVIGVLIYGAVCALCWFPDQEEEVLLPIAYDESLSETPKDSQAIQLPTRKPSRSGSFRTISQLQSTARG